MRKELAPLDGQRAYFTATVADFGIRRSLYRCVTQTLLANIEHDGRRVCDHIWLDGHLHPELKRKRIRLSVVVVPYRRKNGQRDYGFRKPDSIKIIGEGF